MWGAASFDDSEFDLGDEQLLHEILMARGSTGAPPSQPQGAALVPGATEQIQFAWAPCSYKLFREDGGEWPVMEAPLGAPVSMRVEAAKALTAPSGSTFRWHRNCILPKIQVSVNGGYPALQSAAVLISAVTVDVLGHSAHDVGLEGITLRPLVNGACSFSSLSFKTTSYNLPGRPSVHLMVSLLIRGKDAPASSDVRVPIDTGSGPPANVIGSLHIAASAISPAMTVDARKRQAKSSTSQATTPPRGASDDGPASSASTSADARPALLPFAPDLLDRKLEKVGKETSRQAIDNTIDGLRAYLSALNIRNKCKHPLFLVLRFDACIGLLYDSTTERNPAEDDGAFFRMVEYLGDTEAYGGAGGNPGPLATGSMSRFGPFVIAVKSDHGPHICDRTDCPVKLSSAFSLPHSTALPSSFKMLCERQLATLRRTYCRLHCTHGPRDVARSGELMGPTTCGACHVAHPQAQPVNGDRGASVQRHAATLLATVKQLAAQDEAVEGCPEREWELGFHLLAEAMSMHCRTRSAAEIVGFMNDEEMRANKQLASTHFPRIPPATGSACCDDASCARGGQMQGLPLPPTLGNSPAFFDHSHGQPSTGCPECLGGVDIPLDETMVEAIQVEHAHDHQHQVYST